MKKLSLGENKDVDRNILLSLSDRQILEVCSLNKYYVETVCDDEFFHRILQQRYPGSILWNKEWERKMKKKSWKQLYIETIYYLGKLIDMGFNYYDVSKNFPRYISSQNSPQFFYYVFDVKRLDISSKDEKANSIAAAFNLKQKELLEFLMQRYRILSWADLLTYYRSGYLDYPAYSGSIGLNSDKDMETFVSTFI